MRTNTRQIFGKPAHSFTPEPFSATRRPAVALRASLVEIALAAVAQK